MSAPESLPFDARGYEASVRYDSSNGGLVTKRGPVIYQYGDEGDDRFSVHILLDSDRVLTASTSKPEVRSVAVENALVEDTGDTPGPEGYDVLAAKYYGRKVGETPSISLVGE